jgi:GT2 family glycosyltransferase
MLPLFSIIIVTYNGLSDLRKCLASIENQISCDWEMIVVDNGSTDGTIEFLRTYPSPYVHCVLLNSNVGFAKANNIGFQHARGSWIFLLNNDTECGKETLAALKTAAKAASEYSIFSCRMIRMSDGKIDNLGIRFTRALRGVQISSGMVESVTDPNEVFGASGGAMLVHRSVIEDIGLFDPNFFAYQEDVDFAVRSRLAGYRCCHLPLAIIYHKGGGTSGKRPALYRYYNQRNMELVLKHIPLQTLCLYGALHCFYVVYQLIKWSVRLDGPNVIRAKWHALSLIVRSPEPCSPIRISEKSFRQMLNNQFVDCTPVKENRAPAVPSY